MFNIKIGLKINIQWLPLGLAATLFFLQPSIISANESEKALPPSTLGCQLKMGWVPWPPYQYLNDAAKIDGIQSKLFRTIAGKANCRLTFIRGNWKDIQAGIKNGTIDLMGDATITDFKLSFAHFSAPYRAEILALYVSKERLKKYLEMPLRELMQKCLVKKRFLST